MHKPQSIAHIFEHLDYDGQYQPQRLDDADMFCPYIDPITLSEYQKSYAQKSLLEMRIIQSVQGEENWMKPMLSACESIGMFATTVVMLVYYSPWITLTIFATSALAFLIPNAMGDYLSKRQQGLSKEMAAFMNKVKNILSGFDVIHSFNMLSHINKNFATYNEQLAQRKYEADHFYDSYTIVD